MTDSSKFDCHAASAEECLRVLNSSTEGLDGSEADRRLADHGPNLLPAPKKRHPFLSFLSHFHNVLIYVLLASAVVTTLLDHLFDTLVILAVVVVNAVIGFIQEGKAEKAMASIRRMLATRAAVLRAGERKTVDGEGLVPGDIVLLEAGDRVPADLRLLRVNGLQVQEAMLTGESAPVEKAISPVSAEAALGDRTCMAFSGTMVTSGLGRGVVTATGPDSEIGRISGMLSDVTVLTTPLVRQMDVFAKWLTGVILVVAAILLGAGYYFADRDFTEMFMAVVGLSVAAIPEGLPAVLTITLAVGVQAMARRNAIVRRLPAIETLGSVSVICSDKTGTLTRNEMMVTSVATSAHLFALDGEGYSPVGSVKLDDTAVEVGDHTVLARLGQTAALCNDAALHEEEGFWMVEGDPMEGALMALAGKLGLDSRREQAAWARTDVIPFDSDHRFMATLNHDHEGNAAISVKGAPEQVIAMCSRQLTVDGTSQGLAAEPWQALAEEMAGRGQRVLAFATRSASGDQTVLEFRDVEGGLTLIALVGLIDPPRSEAIEAVRECYGAGIRVKMITGDHAGTAAAIGRQIGLGNPDRVLTGVELEAMDDAALAAAVVETDIFARTSPEHKLRLVKALQAHGLTVAMTGDGVNDAPALKRADAGIAMGRKGSEATKEVSDLVLADDNFASIVAAVREGRTVYDNIKKVISWTLPTNAGEAMTIVVALLLGMTLPITPIQILWVNLITAVTLGIALAFEPTEPHSMRRPPRPHNEPLLTGDLAWHIVLVSSLFLAGVFGMYALAIDRGQSIEMARTIALNTLVVMEIFHLLFIRNIYGTSLTWKAVRGTRMVWAMISIVTAAQLAITYLPPLQIVFDTRPIALLDGIMIVGVGIALFIVIECEKQVRLALTKRHEGGSGR
ncbi:MAG: cation-transporting P-type ATPase [Alphaproteobacteria bacterium]|nr:cation-transporting P-type ATPase [Alphaproteobacteria bacterium]